MLLTSFSQVRSEACIVSQRHIVRSMNYLVALYFAVDAIMKMIAKGVLLTPTAYFQVRSL